MWQNILIPDLMPGILHFHAHSPHHNSWCPFEILQAHTTRKKNLKDSRLSAWAPPWNRIRPSTSSCWTWRCQETSEDSSSRGATFNRWRHLQSEPHRPWNMHLAEMQLHNLNNTFRHCDLGLQNNSNNTNWTMIKLNFGSPRLGYNWKFYETKSDNLCG